MMDLLKHREVLRGKKELGTHYGGLGDKEVEEGALVAPCVVPSYWVLRSVLSARRNKTRSKREGRSGNDGYWPKQRRREVKKNLTLSANMAGGKE